MKFFMSARLRGERPEKSESLLPPQPRGAVSIPGRGQGIVNVHKRDGGIRGTLETTSHWPC